MDFSKIDRQRFIEAEMIVARVRAEAFWDTRTGPQILELPAVESARLPVKKAAEYVGIGETRFRQLLKAKRMPEPRHWNGNRPLWEKADLDKYLASSRRGK